MSDYSSLAKSLVLEWAKPYEAFDTPQAQINRAHDNLHAWELHAGLSKVWNAFYGKAGQPTYEALKRQAAVVRERNKDKQREANAKLRAQFVSTLELMRETDEEFFRRQIEAYSAITRELGREGSEGG